jgi:hypothetical protein
MDPAGAFGLRLGVTALIAFKIFDICFAPALIFAYRMDFLGMAERLGKMTPGDDYQRLIPLMQTIPAWLLGLEVLGGLLYAVTIVFILMRIDRAYLFALGAFVMEIIATLVGKPFIRSSGVVVNPHPSVFSSLCIPIFLPLLIILLAWLLRGTPRDKPR